MARGYPNVPSVAPGDTLDLFITTGARLIRLDFFRQGAELKYSGRSGWYDGPAVAPGNNTADQDFGWPRYPFQVRPHGADA
jgi:hypothetical protein